MQCNMCMSGDEKLIQQGLKSCTWPEDGPPPFSGCWLFTQCVASTSCAKPLTIAACSLHSTIWICHNLQLIHCKTRCIIQQNLVKIWSDTLLCGTVYTEVLTWPLQESSRQSRRLGR